MTAPERLQCRPAGASDLRGILAIQAERYPAAMQESASTIMSRMQAAGDTCWVALMQGRVCGYLFAYRSRRGLVTPLGADFAPAANGDTLYLHDLAVSSLRVARGLGRLLVALAEQFGAAHGCAWAGLVAVGDAAPYWKRLGYGEQPPLVPDQEMHLRTYPGKPVYLLKALSAAAPRGS